MNKLLKQVAVFLLIALAAVPVAAQSRPADFGKQWVRANPFTIMGVATSNTTFDIAQYRAAGMTTVFANPTIPPIRVIDAAVEAGMPWQYTPWEARPYQAYSDAHKSFIDTEVSRGFATGVLLPDEPISSELDALAESAQWLRQAHPDLLSYVNVGPESGSSFLDDVLSKVQPDVLMFDNYPLRSNGDNAVQPWFRDVMTIRNKAQAAGIPYWGWVQTYTSDPTNGGLDRPSESDVRYLDYTLLTAGYTGINYYIYDQPGPGANVWGFFDSNGNKRAIYDYVADVNQEIQNLGRALRFLNSTDVRWVRGLDNGCDGFEIFGNCFGRRYNESPDGNLAEWSSNAGDDPNIVSIDVTSSGPEKNGLVGFFTDDNGQLYFMLTNLNHAKDTSAVDASLGFTITFDSSINELLRLNRETGEQELILLTNNTLNLTLPGGTGDLFKYNTGDFVPEPASGLLVLLAGGLMVGRRRCKP